jgi:hypothetical protein
LKPGPEDRLAGARLVRDFDFLKGGTVENDLEKLKMKMARDEGEDVEGHKLDLTEDEKLKMKMKMAADEGEDVEGHKM